MQKAHLSDMTIISEAHLPRRALKVQRKSFCRASSVIGQSSNNFFKNKHYRKMHRTEFYLARCVVLN